MSFRNLIADACATSLHVPYLQQIQEIKASVYLTVELEAAKTLVFQLRDPCFTGRASWNFALVQALTLVADSHARTLPTLPARTHLVSLPLPRVANLSSSLIGRRC